MITIVKMDSLFDAGVSLIVLFGIALCFIELARQVHTRSVVRWHIEREVISDPDLPSTQDPDLPDDKPICDEPPPYGYVVQ